MLFRDAGSNRLGLFVIFVIGYLLPIAFIFFLLIKARNLPVKENGKSSDYETGLEIAKDKILRNLDEIKEKTGADLNEASNRQEKLTKIFKDFADNSKKPN
jgi:large-conductance mechanosensitive channel